MRGAQPTNRAVNVAVTLTQEGGVGLKLRPSKLPSESSESMFHAPRNGRISVDRHYIWCATSDLWTTPFLLVLGFCLLEGFDQQLRCLFGFNFFRRPTSLFSTIYSLIHPLSRCSTPFPLWLYLQLSCSLLFRELARTLWSLISVWCVLIMVVLCGIHR